jgi:cyclic-di-GMP phosphodiesterase TipF (flagellum assembly factor)
LRVARRFVKLATAIRNQSKASPVAMTQQLAVPDDAPPPVRRYGDAFVVFSMTVLTCAVGAWLITQLSVPLWTSSLVALGVYATLLSFHLLVRRSLVSSAAAAAAANASSRHAPELADAPGPETPALAAKTPPPLPPLPPLPPEPALGAEPAGSDKRRPPEAVTQPRPVDPFNFRPSREPLLPASALPGFVRDPAPVGGLPRTGSAPAIGDASSPEVRVEHVQELIKKLADELNTATGPGSGPARGSGPPPGPVSAPAAGNERPAAPSGRAPDTEAMINRSVDALEATARGMHGRRRVNPPPPPPPSNPPAATDRARWWPAPPPNPTQSRGPARGATPPQVNPQLARVAEAVAAERIEVLLEPIHALIEGRPRHFEVSTRLLTPEGGALDRRAYVAAARGSGLLPRIDAAKMIRAARIASRLGRRGREGAVLTSITGDALADRAFLEAASAPRGEGSMGLVLSLAQSEVRAFTPGHAKALGNLAALGLRFALEAVTDLDMDFAALKGMGFAFVELDAPVFLDGLPAGGGRVPAADICRHLANFGLALIVGRIDDDWLLARILGFGVLFGKGALFGGPRPVKDEVIAASSAA